MTMNTMSLSTHANFIGNSTLIHTNIPSASTTRGMLLTLAINMVMFTILVIVFESNRSYKQIFLKRYQKRFITAGKIPSEPYTYFFGWLTRILQVEEVDVLYMVGLDAYMLLRYHVVCLKLVIDV